MPRDENGLTARQVDVLRLLMRGYETPPLRIAQEGLPVVERAS